MASKRRRTGDVMVVQRSARRPIDKNLVNVAQTVSTSQTSTDLITATFPCTITGLRWSMSYVNDTTALSAFKWAIILVKDGLSASTMATSDGSSLYDPEQNVLAFGDVAALDRDAGTGTGSLVWEGDTKTMRKLMGGDKLVCIAKSSQGGGSFRASIQFFCKS